MSSSTRKLSGSRRTSPQLLRGTPLPSHSSLLAVAFAGRQTGLGLQGPRQSRLEPEGSGRQQWQWCLLLAAQSMLVPQLLRGSRGWSGVLIAVSPGWRERANNRFSPRRPGVHPLPGIAACGTMNEERAGDLLAFLGQESSRGLSGGREHRGAHQASSAMRCRPIHFRHTKHAEPGQATAAMSRQPAVLEATDAPYADGTTINGQSLFEAGSIRLSRYSFVATPAPWIASNGAHDAASIGGRAAGGVPLADT